MKVGLTLTYVLTKIKVYIKFVLYPGCSSGCFATLWTGREDDNPKVSQTPVSEVQEYQGQQDHWDDHVDVLQGVLELPRWTSQRPESDSYKECGNEDNWTNRHDAQGKGDVWLQQLQALASQEDMIVPVHTLGVTKEFWEDK